MTKKSCGFRLRKLDIFGQNISLRLDESNSSKTIFGGILTILAVLSILVVGIYSSLDLIKRAESTTTFLDLATEEFQKFKLGKNELTFAFSFQYEIFDLFKVDIYIPEVILYIPSISEKIELPIQKCTKEDFEDLAHLHIIYGKYYCVNYNLIKEELSIEGSNLDADFKYISISLVGCKEGNSKGGSCRNYSNFYDGLIGDVGYSTVDFIIKEGLINPLNYTNPLSYNYRHYSLHLKSGYTQQMNVFLKKLELETDDGWLIERKKNDFSFEIKEFESYEIPIYPKYQEYENFDVLKTYGKINIFSGNTIRKVKRTYKKIQNIAYEIGGIVSILLNLCPFLNYIFSETNLDEKLLNQIFDFDFSGKTKNQNIINLLNNKIERQEQKLSLNKNNSNFLILNNEESKISEIKVIDQNNFKPKESLILSTNIQKSRNKRNSLSKEISQKIIQDNNLSDINNIMNIKTQTNKYLYSIPRILKRVRNNINNREKMFFSFGQVILINCLCCFLSKNNILYEKYFLYKKSKKLIGRFRDILYLIETLNQFEKLKYILLSEEQLSLFKMISNDIFSLKELSKKNNSINLISKDFENSEMMKNICLDYLGKIKNNTVLPTEIDSRLLNFIKK